MCGITAIFSNTGPRPLEDTARAMTRLVAHRGPDGDGIHCWPAAAFGHRRLAIIDLSETGRQPMFADDGTAIVLNGEIYNHRSLRQELRRAGHEFRGRSDTEVLLNAYKQWGPGCLGRLNGMFAFVVHDPNEGIVFAARDRFGVKPLYWWTSPDGVTAFASEIKQFTVLPGWAARVDRQRAYDFLNFGLTDHTGATMFDGVRQVPPGHYLHAEAGDLEQPERHIRRWYELRAVPEATSATDAADAFRDLFTDAVRLRLNADVPVGTALSGGLDSSSIVCTVGALSKGGGKRHSFSAFSEDPRFDERRYVDEVVRRCGTQAHFVNPQLDDFIDGLDRVIWHHDEPPGGASVFAEWEVFRTVATTEVKVTLDGHGADEQLAGYHDFFKARFVSLAERGQWSSLARELAAARRRHGHGAGYLVRALADAWLPEPVRQFTRRATGKPSAHVDWMDTTDLGVEVRGLFGRARDLRAMSRAQLTATSLPMQLRWNDRDSMAHGIESRAPFLDYRLVEFLLGCPDETKIADGTTKRVLRDAMRGTVPEAILERQDKMGFVTPERAWIVEQHPERFNALVDEAVERAGAIVNGRAAVRAKEIIAGKRPFDLFVWRLICFGRWLDVFDVRA